MNDFETFIYNNSNNNNKNQKLFRNFSSWKMKKTNLILIKRMDKRMGKWVDEGREENRMRKMFDKINMKNSKSSIFVYLKKSKTINSVCVSCIICYPICFYVLKSKKGNSNKINFFSRRKKMKNSNLWTRNMTELDRTSFLLLSILFDR